MAERLLHSVAKERCQKSVRFFNTGELMSLHHALDVCRHLLAEQMTVWGGFSRRASALPLTQLFGSILHSGRRPA